MSVPSGSDQEEPKVKLEWEEIDPWHKRAKVPGGWIVKAYEDVWEFTEARGFVAGQNYRIAMVFVPDSMYAWQPIEGP